MINCPACGSNFEGELCLGCPSCGARSVGPPLARAEHELRSYGRAVAVTATGVAMSGVFLASVIAVLVEWGVVPTGFWAFVGAGETAAWRLKWVMLPLSLIVLWGGAWVVRTMKASPKKFMGLRAARLGLAASALVTLMIATLIGITIPERLHQRQLGIEAGVYAQGYTLTRAMLEFREMHGTFPQTNLMELREVPDPDGSIAEALRNVDPIGYNPSTVLAAASTKSKPLASRGSAIRKAGFSPDPPDRGGVSFTSYDLRLPGPDKILNTDDDFIMHDGLIKKVSELESSSARPNTP